MNKQRKVYLARYKDKVVRIDYVNKFLRYTLMWGHPEAEFSSMGRAAKAFLEYAHNNFGNVDRALDDFSVVVRTYEEVTQEVLVKEEVFSG